MAKKNEVGSWAFKIGVFGSLLVGLLAGLGYFEASAMITLALVIAGVLIGALHVSDKESSKVMIIALVLGIGGASLSVIPFIGVIMSAMFVALAKVMIPAGMVVAVKSSMDL